MWMPLRFTQDQKIHDDTPRNIIEDAAIFYNHNSTWTWVQQGNFIISSTLTISVTNNICMGVQAHILWNF